MAIRQGIWSLKRLTLAVISLTTVVVEADQHLTSPFIDREFTCPIGKDPNPPTITCPVVCVRDLNLCPQEMQCEDGEVLCGNDGKCYATQAECDLAEDKHVCDSFCGGHEVAHEEEGLMPCKIGYQDIEEVCVNKFETFYNDCKEVAEEELVWISYASIGYLVCYAWLIATTVIAYGFILYNERINPIKNTTWFEMDSIDKLGTAKPSEASNEISSPDDLKVHVEVVQEKEHDDTNTDKKMNDNSGQFKGGQQQDDYVREHMYLQMGYKRSAIGTLAYWMVNATTVGWQVLLVLLTWSYYADSRELHDPSFFQPLLNYEQSLITFEFVWMAGFLWSLMVKYPEDMLYQYQRRCSLEEAEMVRVWAPMQTRQVKALGSTTSFLMKVNTFFDSVFSFILSDVNKPRRPGAFYSCPVKRCEVSGKKIIVFQLKQLVLDETNNRFQDPNLSISNKVEALIKGRKGLTSEEVKQRAALIGANKVPIPIPSVLQETVGEFGKVFYVYQIFMIWTWLQYDYYHMGLIYLAIVGLAGLLLAYISYNNKRDLYELSKDHGNVRVCRDGKFQTISSTQLVPGDVIIVQPGVSPCDMILLEGRLVLDESSLTGECAYVSKVAIEKGDRETYDPIANKKNTVFAGTKVLQGTIHEGGFLTTVPLGLVIKTGVNTDKGKMVREILHRPANVFKFTIQAKAVVAILALYAVVGFSITLSFIGDQPLYGWFYAMYVVGTALPPLLPTVFTLTLGVSSRRLKPKGILATEPQSLLAAGKVRIACFDKTGTLTQQGMDFSGIRPVQKLLSDNQEIVFFKDESKKVASGGSLEEMAMATCHSLSLSMDGDLIGSSVDVKMFEAIRWKLKEGDVQVKRDVNKDVVFAPDGIQALKIQHRFEFDHERAAMTSMVYVTDAVTIRKEIELRGVNGGANTNHENDDDEEDEDYYDSLRDKYMVFTKGSSEAITRICRPSSLPADYKQISNKYSQHGYYVIALASRHCTAQEIKALRSEQSKDILRGDVERDMNFVGFIFFKNELKADSKEAIKILKEGSLRNVMITGDHHLTGLHIAREVEMVELGTRVLFATEVSEEGEIQWKTEDGTLIEAPNNAGEIDDDVELIINGNAWGVLKSSGWVDRDIMLRARIFARMSPTDKLEVIQTYVDHGLTVAMCGDGGNDCGALRASHIGLALSDSEASIVSPFTSTSKSIHSMVDLLLEGRCTLATSFACYKYMIMYGQIETLLQIINAYYGITFGQWNWVFMDGIWTVVLALSLAMSKPLNKLSKFRPSSSLLGHTVVLSIVGLVIVNAAFMIMSLGILNMQDWYQCRKFGGTDISEEILWDNYEAVTLFLVGGAQYISTAMALNFGFKHRMPWVFNWTFVVISCLFMTLQVIITFYPSRLSCMFRVNCENEYVVRQVTSPDLVPITNDWHTTVLPFNYPTIIFALIAANTFALMAWEYLVIYGPVGNWVRKQQPRTIEVKS